MIRYAPESSLILTSRTPAPTVAIGFQSCGSMPFWTS